MMNKMVMFIALFILSGSVFAASTFEEVYIPGANKEVIKLISSHPELTIDHMDSDGFELYGPAGTKKWLKDAGIYFEKAHSHMSVSLSRSYPSYKKLVNNLKRIVALNPKIAKMESIGKSVKGLDLWVVKLSDNVEVDEVEPEFKYISSMHGNEITGRPLTQMLLEDMIKSYGTDERITDLINNTEIYIMPSMNPDGSKKQQRGNANRVDLNRNFPDWTKDDPNTSKGRQPETAAVMKFQAAHKFSLSANFHGGAYVVNYPWDSSYRRHPLNNLLHNISKKYAAQNPVMRNSTRFDDGVTNGADWYVLKGGMQDWSYVWYDDLQVTVEVSKLKWPRWRDIPRFYKDNKESMLVYMGLVHQGAGFKIAGSSESGVVTIVKQAGSRTRNLGSFGFSGGEFYKVLEKGDYVFSIKTDGNSALRSVQVHVNGDLSVENGNFVSI